MISVLFGIAAVLGVVALLAIGLSCLVNDDCQSRSEAYREMVEEAPSPDHPFYKKAA
ncbi:MAG: hypothetical protein L0Y56_12305 [Nitrospira sp.]|nr:hypothetical protein [Nitrospira sp.]